MAVKKTKGSLSLPHGVTLDDLEKVDADKLRKTMMKGIYLTELFLFNQASYEAQRLESTRHVMDVLSESLFDDERMSKVWADGGYDLETKVELLKLARDMNRDGLKFLGDLHRSVATGLETVKSIERHGEEGIPDDRPSKKKAVREMRQMLELEMASRVKELEGKNNSGK